EIPRHISLVEQDHCETSGHHSKLVEKEVELPRAACPNGQFRQKHGGVYGNQEVGDIGSGNSRGVVFQRNHETGLRAEMQQGSEFPALLDDLRANLTYEPLSYTIPEDAAPRCDGRRQAAGMDVTRCGGAHAPRSGREVHWAPRHTGSDGNWRP